MNASNLTYLGKLRNGEKVYEARNAYVIAAPKGIKAGVMFPQIDVSFLAEELEKELYPKPIVLITSRVIEENLKSEEEIYEELKREIGEEAAKSIGKTYIQLTKYRLHSLIYLALGYSQLLGKETKMGRKIEERTDSFVKEFQSLLGEKWDRYKGFINEEIVGKVTSLLLYFPFVERYALITRILGILKDVKNGEISGEVAARAILEIIPEYYEYYGMKVLRDVFDILIPFVEKNKRVEDRKIVALDKNGKEYVFLPHEKAVYQRFPSIANSCFSFPVGKQGQRLFQLIDQLLNDYNAVECLIKEFEEKRKKTAKEARLKEDGIMVVLEEELEDILYELAGIKKREMLQKMLGRSSGGYIS